MTVSILALGALVFLAHLFGIVFQRTRVPDVLLLTLIGLLLGPVFGVLEPRDLGQVGQVLSGVALVVILFESGTTTDLGALVSALRPTMTITLTTFALTALLAGSYGIAVLGLSPLGGVLLGFILGGTSSAVVIPLVKGLGLRERTQTILILESAVTDVLCIVLVFGVVEAAGRGSIDPLRMVGTIMASMLFAGLLGVVGGIAWMRFLPLVRRLPNTIAASVAFVLVVYGVTELLGFSGGIAALAFGITLTNHERFTVVETLAKRPGTTVGATLLPAERQVFSEAVFLLKTLFFVYLGVSIKFGSVLAFGGAVLITALVYLGRLVLASRLLSRDTPFRDATIVSVMIPKGLAAAVLASVPVQAGLEGGATIRDATYAVVLLSLITTSAMGFASERAPLRAVYERIFHRFPREAPAPQALPSGQVGADGGAGSAVEPSSQS